jgi:hypothetical protein
LQKKGGLGRNKVMINSVMLSNAKVKHRDVKAHLTGWCNFHDTPRKHLSQASSIKPGRRNRKS